MTTTETDPTLADAQVHQLWAELGRRYNAAGKSAHFQILRKMDLAYHSELDRAGQLERARAAWAQRERERMKTWEREHPEEFAALQRDQEQRRAQLAAEEKARQQLYAEEQRKFEEAKAELDRKRAEALKDPDVLLRRIEELERSTLRR